MTVGKHTAEQIFAIVKNLAYMRMLNETVNWTIKSIKYI